MKKNFFVIMLGILLVCLIGCAEENVQKREDTVKISQSEVKEGTPTLSGDVVTPTKPATPTREVVSVSPTITPKVTPTPTPVIVAFPFDITQIKPEKVINAEEAREAWGEAQYPLAFINIRESMVAVWKAKSDWMSATGNLWDGICDVYTTDWDNCEFYIYVEGYEDVEAGGWAYMKINKDQFAAFVDSRTVDDIHWVETGEVHFNDKLPVSIWIQNGRIIRIVEMYIG